jgi:taurine dioxygenase
VRRSGHFRPARPGIVDAGLEHAFALRSAAELSGPEPRRKAAATRYGRRPSSESVRRLVDGLPRSDLQHGFKRYLWGVGERRVSWERAVAANPPVAHPVVRTVDGGRRGLFVNKGFTSRIIELKPKETGALLAFLFAHIAKPEFTVCWRSKLGDVAFWDNCLSTHYATLDYLPQNRVMTRAAILGDRPR